MGKTSGIASDSDEEGGGRSEMCVLVYYTLERGVSELFFSVCIVYCNIDYMATGIHTPRKMCAHCWRRCTAARRSRLQASTSLQSL